MTAHTTTKNMTLVVAETNVAQPLAAEVVTKPILEALAAAGGTGPINWRVERLDNGAKRIHASCATLRQRSREGWDAYATA